MEDIKCEVANEFFRLLDLRIHLDEVDIALSVPIARLGIKIADSIERLRLEHEIRAIVTVGAFLLREIKESINYVLFEERAFV